MLYLILRTLIWAPRSRRALAVENLALRHQLVVLQRNARKPPLPVAGNPARPVGGISGG